MDFLRLSLALSLIPALALASQQPATNNSNARAPQSHAIGEHPAAPVVSLDQEHKANHEKEPAATAKAWWSEEKACTNNGDQFYLQRAEEIVSGARIFCKYLDAKGLQAKYITELIEFDLPIIALFEAADHGDTTSVISLRGKVFLGSIEPNDRRIQYLNLSKKVAELLKSSANEVHLAQANRLADEFLENGDNPGIDLKTVIAARGDKDMMEALLAYEKEHDQKWFWSPVQLKPEMVDPNAIIDATAITTFYENEACHYYLVLRMPRKVPLGAWLDKDEQWGKLAAAAVAGRADVVDLIIEKCLPQIDSSVQKQEIAVALSRLADYSNLTKTKLIDPLLNAVGIKQKPQRENYPTITRKLCKAYLALGGVATAGWNENAESHNFVASALKWGSPEVLRVMAEEFANAQSILLAHHPCEIDSAERLGILLSVDAHQDSIVSRLSMPTLIWLERRGGDPSLAAGLKKYIQEQNRNTHQEETATELNKYLSRVSSNIVADYLLFMPYAMQQRILKIGEPAGS